MSKLDAAGVFISLAICCSTPSYAEWREVVETFDGDSIYIDFDRVKKNNGYVYFWELFDYLKPTKFGDLSSVSLWETDCTPPRKLRRLAATYHTQSRGKGAPSTTDNNQYDWVYPKPKSSFEVLVDTVCRY